MSYRFNGIATLDKEIDAGWDRTMAVNASGTFFMS